MKKLLLILATALISFSGFAQDMAETETSPKMTLTVKILEPRSEISEVEYEMINTDFTVTKALSPVYYFIADLPTFEGGNTKIQFIGNYTDGEKNYSTTYQITHPQALGDVKVVLAFYLNEKSQLQYHDSYREFILGDANWTGVAYIPSIYNGQTQQEVYFNTTSTSYKNEYTLATANYDYTRLQGSNATPLFATNSWSLNSLNKATIDYTKSTVTFSQPEAISLNILNILPFVSPIDVIVPDGVNVFVYDNYENGVLSVKKYENKVINANTPVILKVNKADIYEFAFAPEAEFKYTLGDTTDKYRYYVDSEYENSGFFGVHTPHYAPDNSYIFNGTEFVSAPSNNVVSTLECYLQLAEKTVESIAIVFPEEEEPVEPEDVLYVHFTDANGKHLQTHWTVLEKQDNGTYANEEVDIAHYQYFVLADATFEETISTLNSNPFDEYPSNREWSELGDAYVYHVSEVTAQEDVNTTPNKTNFVKTKASELSGEFTPFSIGTSGYKYDMTLDAEKGTLTLTNSGTTTGIGNVSIDATNTNDDRIFNIFGQQVDRNYKGIVIQNGKKFILR